MERARPDRTALIATQTDRLNTLLLALFCKLLIPFMVVERPEFIDFVNELNPNYKLPTRNTLSGVMLHRTYHEKKAEVTRSLERTKFWE